VPPDGTAVEVRLTPKPEHPPFPNYTQLPTRIPPAAWQAGRFVTLAAALALCLDLVVDPDTGLKLFWGLLVPLLPLLWLVAPGLWRNLCPLAASNQLPRRFGFSRAGTARPGWTRLAYTVGIAAFLVLVPMRKVLFNRSGPATAVLLLTGLGLAFAGGVVLKGKSGWCSTLCPLLPVQRLYGETPFVLVRNSHCEPCVGCAKNCFDFNPRAAKLADLTDDDPGYVGPRRLFAAAYPGLVLGFFSMPNLPAQSTGWVCGRVALFVAVSVALYELADAFLPLSDHQLTAAFAAIALNAFYWYAAPALVDTLGRSPTGAARSVPVWVGRALVLGLSGLWLVRTLAKEAPFRAAQGAAPEVAPEGLAALQGRGDEPSVTFVPDGPEVAVKAGTPLLEVMEAAGLPIEAGCRLGVCGADPIAVLEGGDALTPPGADEQSTLERLGLAESTRLACQARVHGACMVALRPERASGPRTPIAATGFTPDPGVRRLVIIGNGIAGASAADHARRLHPDCEIDLVGLESHRLYNRMAITRLIYGRSAMQGLYLLPDDWYDDHEVTCWLNTRVRSLDPADRTVLLATGETLAYDRLILANGSRSVVPDVPGIDRPGCFTLRDADDAITLRAFVQEHDVRTAVVAGGGLLGLESAYALHQLGLDTTVLERGPWVLRRQLDETAARLVERYLAALGITIVTQAVLGEVVGGDRVEGVVLADGRTMPAGVLLSCPGVVPNVELARDAGLAVARGVVVDDHLRTSDPNVYAAGDVAEVAGEVAGLWPASTRQGEVAATNAVGGDLTYAPGPPTTLLKVVGLEAASIGRIDASGEGDVVIAHEDEEEARYRRLVLRDGRAVGAVLVGHARDVPAIQRAVEEGRELSELASELGVGYWSGPAKP
jgi:NADPH-dependent 2,4-dienoyl-CoA reductase/sulfur reductase-like enzyme/ferredoxin